MRNYSLLFLFLGGFVLSCTKQQNSQPDFEIIQARLHSLPEGPNKDVILYGRELFLNTPKYIGPSGSVTKLTGNLLTCNNCHLEGGARVGGLDLLDSHGLYPQFRSREGQILTLSERINSCIKMPLLGEPLEPQSREMQALLLYIRFLGEGRVIKDQRSENSLPQIKYPDEAASPDRGRQLYLGHCQRCHGGQGEGAKRAGEESWLYPPLWGMGSYRLGSSMHRVSMFARYIKANMPFDLATANKPVLSDKEALDIAAFVNSESINPRPKLKPGQVLYNDIQFKPFDCPIGPYVDPFSVEQHKYGPFTPILDFYKTLEHGKIPAPGDKNAP